MWGRCGVDVGSAIWKKSIKIVKESKLSFLFFLPYIDPTSTLHRPYIDPTSTPHRPYIDPTSTPHRPYIDPTSTLHRPHIDPTSTLHRPYIDPTSTLHRPYIDPTSTPHRPHIDPTSTPHRPHTDPTVDDYMRRLYGVDRRVLKGSRLFSSGPLCQKLQGFVWDFFTRRVPIPEPLLSHYSYFWKSNLSVLFKARKNFAFMQIA